MEGQLFKLFKIYQIIIKKLTKFHVFGYYYSKGSTQKEAEHYSLIHSDEGLFKLETNTLVDNLCSI